MTESLYPTAKDWVVMDGWMDGWRDGGQQYPGVPIMEVQVDVYTPDGIAMWVNGGATLCLFFWFLMSSIV